MDPLQALASVKSAIEAFKNEIGWELIEGPIYKGELVIAGQVELQFVLSKLGDWHWRMGSATLVEAKTIVHLPSEMVDELLPLAEAWCTPKPKLEPRPEKVTVAECWRRFALFVVPDDATEKQREDMRHTFYAGFVDCFQAMQVISHTSKTEEEASQRLTELEAECSEPFEQMMQAMKGSRS